MKELEMPLSKGTSDTRKSNGHIDASVHELEDRIDELRSEIASLAKSLASLGASKVEHQLQDYRDVIEKLAGEAVHASAKALDSARAEANALEEAFETRVKSNPLQAIGIAAGIGFLAAILLRRR
jgi:ElaB/YqjD/DUF883 family membrane-anchored ribosome-binding protein